MDLRRSNDFVVFLTPKSSSWRLFSYRLGLLSATDECTICRVLLHRRRYCVDGVWRGAAGRGWYQRTAYPAGRLWYGAGVRWQFLFPTPYLPPCMPDSRPTVLLAGAIITVLGNFPRRWNSKALPAISFGVSSAEKSAANQRFISYRTSLMGFSIHLTPGSALTALYGNGDDE